VIGGKVLFYFPDAPCISMYGIFTYIWLQYMVASGFYQNENTFSRGITSHNPTENRKDDMPNRRSHDHYPRPKPTYADRKSEGKEVERSLGG